MCWEKYSRRYKKEKRSKNLSKREINSEKKLSNSKAALSSQDLPFLELRHRALDKRDAKGHAQLCYGPRLAECM